MAILKQTRNRWQRTYPTRKLAEAYHHAGDLGNAIDHYQQALAILHEIGDAWREADILLELGRAQKAAGQADSARQSWQLALHIFEEFGDTLADQVRAQLKEITVQGSQQNLDQLACRATNNPP